MKVTTGVCWEIICTIIRDALKLLLTSKCIEFWKEAEVKGYGLVSDFFFFSAAFAYADVHYSSVSWNSGNTQRPCNQKWCLCYTVATSLNLVSIERQLYEIIKKVLKIGCISLKEWVSSISRFVSISDLISLITWCINKNNRYTLYELKLIQVLCK